jgi:hypothetical protein
MGHVHVVDLPAAAPDPPMASERVSPGLVECEGPAVIAEFGRPSSGPIEDAALDDSDDDLKSARGFINGALIAVPIWGLIGLLVWFILGR